MFYTSNVTVSLDKDPSSFSAFARELYNLNLQKRLVNFWFCSLSGHRKTNSTKFIAFTSLLIPLGLSLQAL